MLRQFLFVIDAALPAALFLGLFAGFHSARVRRGGGSDFPVRSACLGVLAAVGMVILKRNTAWIVREYYNLALLLPALAAEAVLLPLVFAPPGRRTPDLLPGPGRAAAAAAVFSWIAFCLPNLLFAPLDFAVGMTDAFNSVYAGKVSGYGLGLGFTAMAFAALRRISLYLPPRSLWPLFAAGFAIFTARDALAALQTLLGRGLLPRSRFLTGLAIDLINRRDWFLYLLLGVAALAAIAVFLANSRVAPPETANPAQARIVRAEARRRRRWSLAGVLILAAAVLGVTAGAAHERREAEPEPPRSAEARDGIIALAIEEVGDGRLHRFAYRAAGGAEARFIVIRKNPSAFGVGLDACGICGPAGYFERDGQVVCNLCDVVMNKATIGFPGGCNPVPLAHRVEGGALIVQAADLDGEAWRFAP